MLEGVVIDDTELFNDKVQEWEHFYSFDRPHDSALDRPLTNACDNKTRTPTCQTTIVSCTSRRMRKQHSSTKRTWLVESRRARAAMGLGHLRGRTDQGPHRQSIRAHFAMLCAPADPPCACCILSVTPPQ
jgi:hypothetical protein